MNEAAILFTGATAPHKASKAWLGRAAQARRIALLLAAKDAAILEAYALECEAQAVQTPKARQAPIAA